MGSKKVIEGILLGAAAGAVVGILLAPQKGTETRKRIAKKCADLTKSVKDKYNKYADAIQDNYDVTKQKLSEVVSDGGDPSTNFNSRQNEQS